MFELQLVDVFVCFCPENSSFVNLEKFKRNGREKQQI